MSGRQEETRKFLNLINGILNSSPEYMRGFSNFMSDVYTDQIEHTARRFSA